MPNLASHMALALDALGGLPGHILEGALGSYVLGATAPDIRVMTQWSRDRTHYASLESEGVGAGVGGFLRANPELDRPERLGRETRAFVAGYMSHLVADQVWIIRVYRPFFGNRQVYRDGLEGNIMDRALQLDMERQSRDRVAGVVPLLEGAEAQVDVGFLGAGTLREWRQRVQGILGRDFSWESLRLFVSRRYYVDGEGALEVVDRFLSSVEQGLDQIYERVPRPVVEAYKEQAIGEMLNFTERYITCDR